MGNCNAKTHALPNNCPPLFSGVKGLYNREKGTRISSSLDFNSCTCYSHKNSSAPRPCSVISGQISNNFAVKKTVIPEKVSRGSFKLSHLLGKSFVENDNPPMDKVKKTAIAEQVCVGGSVNKRSFKLAKLAENSVIDNDIAKESPKLSSLLSHINIEKRNCSARVEEAHAKFKDSESRSSGSFKLTRLKLSSGLCTPYSLAVEDDDKAFGSPMSLDEFSDSSSDLFDIDFRKLETVAGVAFSTH